MSDLIDRLHAAIQAEQDEILSGPDDENEGLPEKAVLTSWVLVCGWLGDDGKAWRTRTSPESQPFWVTTGLIAEAND